MKKLLFLFCLCISFSLFWSCSKSNEEKVKDAFNNYVESNFNNPADLKEIISISFEDSITSEKAIEFDKKNNTLIDSITKRTKQMSDSLDKVLEKILKETMSNTTIYYDSNARTLLEKYENAINESKSYVSNNSFIVATNITLKKSLVDSLEKKNISINIYNIKVREISNNELKIKNYYAYYDNNNDSIKIYTNNNMTNLPSPIYNLYKSCELWLTLSKNRWEKQCQVLLLEKKIIDYLSQKYCKNNTSK